ncbi:flagellin N-terminal helical domain-containing protein [Lederbergia lenta]|uniref:Flagellin n=1 Tax=Lederbergia lenta TaxID=1467 RepID=A0A2X4YI57_LEDLE|nr:flagellin [Lederbergia lenta]MCM3112746.1 flagellin [Lederbergia lenta]MEC2323780.1 flagellin [Lederbergia lenta]SQI51435.1 flagellin domain-containing protein [Lederbergia lenta]
MLGIWNATGLSIINQMNRQSAIAQRSMERISSGLRINRASDDPAGLAISEKMRAQIRGLNMAGRNIQDGISLLQTAEGGLNETHSILQRMRELSVQAANDTYTDEDRKALAVEFEELKQEITRISKNTEFNSSPLLDGSRNSFSIQVGANAGQFVQFSIGNMGAEAIGINDLTIATREDANNAIADMDKAIQKVSSERSKIGAYMNRLEHTYNNTMTMEENLLAAESRIRDADIAKEIMNLTKANILMQANQYVMSMHIQQVQSVLYLLKFNS